MSATTPTTNPTESRRVPSGRNVTLADIAQRVGVTKVTVSYVLNGREGRVRVSEGTRERILSAAKEMGYSPNAVARGLTRRKMDTFTLVMQSPNVFQGGSGFINAMMHGVVEAANAAGYDVMLHTKAQPGVDAEVRSLTDGRADGSLLLRDYDDPLLEQLEGRGHPCVAVFNQPQVEGAWYVDVDNAQGGRLAAEYLLGLGHRRIGFIGGTEHASPVRDRRNGFRAALAEAGFPLRPEWEMRLNYAGDDYAPVVSLMQQPAEERPTALFAWSDDIAVRVITVLRESLGLRVPQDVSVLGFDGTEAVGERGCVPRLTSIRQPIEEIAARGVTLLVARIREEAPAETQIAYPPSLVIRESCAPPASVGDTGQHHCTYPSNEGIDHEN